MVEVARSPDECLREFFPEHDSFRPGQLDVIESVLQGRNTLAVMPTGSGKSLCYQVAAAAIQGFTLVVSPLIALMKDQVRSIEELPFRVEALNSLMDSREQMSLLRGLEPDKPFILFVAPERLRDGLFQAALESKGMRPDMFVVDEAHCISEWGHDFRADYLFIPDFLDRCGWPRVMALTATAGEQVRTEIRQLLKVAVVYDDFAVHRPNLILSVRSVRGREAKQRELLSFIRTATMPGIVYTSGRRTAENLAGLLLAAGVKAAYYHGEMKADDRAKVSDAFMSGQMDVLCATKAFGMGIDKPDIRFVLHYQITESIEQYWQEAGRGGRDGQDCQCVQLYDPSDIRIQKRFIAQSYPQPSAVKKAYGDTLSLGPLPWGGGDERDIPMQLFYNDNAAILLKRFEDVGLITRVGEVMTAVSVDLVDHHARHESFANIIAAVDSASSTTDGLKRLPDIASRLGVSDEEALATLYRAAVEGAIDLGSRADRIIRYRRLKPDITEADLEAIEENMAGRRVYKKQRLDELVAYLENTTKCRARWISEYLGKTMDDCGRCDVCRARVFD